MMTLICWKPAIEDRVIGEKDDDPSCGNAQSDRRSSWDDRRVLHHCC